MGWMHGAPLGHAGGRITWITLPRPGSGEPVVTLTVDSERLRQTEFGRNAAPRKFPKALANVVGEVAQWTAHGNAALAILKRTVHEGAELPSLEALVAAANLRRSAVRRIEALRREWPALSPVAEGLVWLHWHDHDQLGSALDAFEPAAVAMVLDRIEGRQGLVTALRIAQLAAEGTRPTLFALLSDARVWTVPVAADCFKSGLVRAFETMRKLGSVEGDFLTAGLPRPPASLGGDVTGFAMALALRDAKARDRQIRVAEALLPPGLIEQWADWWTSASRLERDARRFFSGCSGGIPEHELDRFWELEARLMQLTPPPEINFPALCELIGCVDAAPPAVFGELSRCLDMFVRLGAGDLVVRRFLERWAPEFLVLRRGWGVVGRLLAAQRRVLEHQGDGDRERLEWIATSLSAEAIDTWIDEGKPQKLIAPTMEALRLVLAEPSAGPDGVRPYHGFRLWEALIDAVAVTGDPSLAASAVVAVRPEKDGLQGQSWRAIFALSGCDRERFKQLAGGWQARHWNCDLAPELERLANDPEIASILTAGLEAGEGRRIVHLVGLSRLCRTLGLTATVSLRTVAALGDVTAYPAEFAPVLSELGRWDQNAGQAALQILGGDFPQPEALAAEVDGLRGLLARRPPDSAARAGLERRIARLEQRILAPAPVSPRRRRNLLDKLERRLAHARLQCWDDALMRVLREGLAGELGVEPAADWLARPEVVQVLVALAGLGAGVRALAFRLIGRSFGPPPWDLREEPANRAFLERLTRLGLDIVPWIDGIGPRAVTAGSRTLVLDLEKDPVEVLRMGAPFETCLAPGGVNFFSTVSNAADINKRVLYARDADGAIQGRCLLALSDDGHIVNFHIYGHQDLTELTAGVKSYVEQLARTMGTTAAARGVIRHLVATNWYDDGPQDVTGQLAFLEDDSAFMRALPGLPPSDIPAALEAALGAGAITPWIVCIVAGHETVQEHPELILPLLPYLTDTERINPWERMTLVSLVRRAGDLRTSLGLLVPLVRQARSLPINEEWLQLQVAGALIELGQPHQALRFIRQTRPSDVRDWPAEWPPRILIAARALRALRRPHRALELARIAAAKGSTEAKAMMAEIEQELGAGP